VRHSIADIFIISHVSRLETRVVFAQKYWTITFGEDSIFDIEVEVGLIAKNKRSAN
jgi:hypothetical protein